MEPVRRGRIGDPWAFRADVVGDDIQHQLHAVAMHGRRQVLIILQRAEVRIHLVHIDRLVSVIILARELSCAYNGVIQSVVAPSFWM